MPLRKIELRKITYYKIMLLRYLILEGYPVRRALRLLKIGGSTYSRYFNLIWGDKEFQREFYSRRLGFDIKQREQDTMKSIRSRYEDPYSAEKVREKDDVKERARRLAELIKKMGYRKQINNH